MPHQGAEQRPQRRDLRRPGPVVVEDDALACQQRGGGDPEIAGVDEVGVAERLAADDRQAASQMTQHGRTAGRQGRHDGEAGRRPPSPLASNRHVQRGVSERAREAGGGGGEDLGVGLPARERVLEGEEDPQSRTPDESARDMPGRGTPHPATVSMRRAVPTPRVGACDNTDYEGRDRSHSHDVERTDGRSVSAAR